MCYGFRAVKINENQIQSAVARWTVSQDLWRTRMLSRTRSEKRLRGSPISARTIADFLRVTLAGGALDVAELEASARSAGLLQENQEIRHAKPFKKAKKSLGIRSQRIGFGVEGRWTWSLPPQLHALENNPKDTETDVETPNERSSGNAAIVENELPEELRGLRVPVHWVHGIALLDHHRAPSDVPLHRWRQFVGDCYRFVSSFENCAERAAILGWDDLALFGCARIRPLENMACAGLLWAVNGDNIVKVYRDWAVIERAEGRSRRVHHRRSSNAAKVTLPWMAYRRNR